MVSKRAGAVRPWPWSSSCDHRVRSAPRSPCRGRSDRSPSGRSTERSVPAGHRAVPRARHRLRCHQWLLCDCTFSQTDTITAAAPASRASGLPSLECHAAVTTCPRHSSVTCNYATKITIYSCRISRLDALSVGASRHHRSAASTSSSTR